MLENNFSIIRLAISTGGILIFLLFELAMPYRPSIVSKPKRWFINIGMTLLNSILLTIIFRGAAIASTAYAQSNNAGVLNMLEFPVCSASR